MNRPSSIPRLQALRLWVGDYGASLLIIVGAICAAAPVLAAPFSILASVAPPVGQAAFNRTPITSLKANPTINGTASSSAPLQFVVNSSTGAVVYSDPALWVQNGHFAETIYPPIPNGTYTINILLGTTTLATSTLTVGLRTQPTIEPDDSLSSYDVADGHLMRFKLEAKNGGPVEVGQLSFDIVPNSADVEDVELYGYTDSAFTNPIIASSTDPLNSVPAEINATSSVVVIDPDQPIEVPAGATYYFDLVATVTPSDTTYDVATTLLSDSNPHFDIYTNLASTTNFLWSPETYGTSSTTTHDWTNGGLVIGLPKDGFIEVRTSPPPTDAPTCSLSASTSSAPQGTPVTLAWSSANATGAVWDTGASDALFGVETYKLGSTTHTYILNVSGPYGQSNCFATVVVPGIATAATSTGSVATSTPDGFTATPTTGSIPLSVVFSGSVNNSKACTAQTFTLGYGDGTASSTITVPANLCKAQTFTFTHSYTKVATSTAGLYKGTGTTTAERIQTQVITPKAKVSGNFNGTSNMASVLFSLSAAARRMLANVLHFLRL